MLFQIMTSFVLQQGGGGIASVIPIVIFFAFFIVPLAGMWKAFQKANEPGWAAIVPIYNAYKMLQIGGNAWWWLLVMLIPVVNLIAFYKMFAGIAEAFGQGGGFTLGLLFLSPIFWPLLGFGSYSYHGTPS